TLRLLRARRETDAASGPDRRALGRRDRETTPRHRAGWLERAEIQRSEPALRRIAPASGRTANPQDGVRPRRARAPLVRPQDAPPDRPGLRRPSRMKSCPDLLHVRRRRRKPLTASRGNRQGRTQARTRIVEREIAAVQR